MRKYQQLLLLVISIVCVVTVLFYRHEYLKLRSVLSVLNFFGNVDNSNTTCVTFNSDLKYDITVKYQFKEPRSVWLKFDNHFLYSSFWENHEDGDFVRTLIVGPKSAFYNYQCRVWFEQGDIIISEPGLVKYDLDLRSLSNSSSINKYFLRCFVQNKPTFGVPYGVRWSKLEANEDIEIAFSPVFYKPQAKLLNTVVCVLPDYSGLPKTNIIEFIAYYNEIGVSDFIIYDSNIQHSIFPFLESISGRDGILSSVTVLSWNFPLDNRKIERLAVEDDCLSRTFQKAKFVAIVTWDDYIMPQSYKLHKMVAPNKISDLLHLSMNRRLCCTNIDDKTKKSSPLFLRKKHCVSQDTIDNFLFVNYKSYGDMKKKRIYQISENIGVINQYNICDKTLQKQTEVISIPDYYNKINNHKLLALWKSHLNTSSIFSS